MLVHKIPLPSSKGLRSIKFLWQFVRHYYVKVLLACISISIVMITLLTLGSVLRNIIDNGIITHNSEALDRMLAILMLGILVLSMASFGRSYFLSWIGEKIVADVREKLFRHLIQLEIDFYEQMRVGEVISRITTDATLIQIGFSNSIPMAFRNILLMLGGLVMMYITSNILTFYALCIIPIILVPLYVFGKKVRKQSKKNQAHLSDLSGFLDESLNGIRTIYAFNHQEYEIKAFSNINQMIFFFAKRRIFIRSILAFLIMLLVFSGISIVLWLGGKSVLAGEITSGSLASFIFYAVLVAASVGSFSEIFSDIQRAVGACERIQEVLLYKPSHISTKEYKKNLPEPARGVLALHNVSFTYPSFPDKKILDNFTVSIAPGEKCAIVGHSGAGKSTIFSLLLRLYDPQSGSLYMDGVKYLDVSPIDIRKRIAVVSQEPYIFSGTIYDNILFGNPSASEKDIFRAVEMANLKDVIKKFPEGINTYIGTRGIALSTGQKQRLSIARAILKNPAILLLDEATNALDVENEKIIEEAITDLMANKTTVMITHKLSSVLRANRIIVMENGHINSIGTHAELILEENSLYKKLASMYFQDQVFSIKEKENHQEF